MTSNSMGTVMSLGVSSPHSTQLSVALTDHKNDVIELHSKSLFFISFHFFSCDISIPSVQLAAQSENV